MSAGRSWTLLGSAVLYLALQGPLSPAWGAPQPEGEEGGFNPTTLMYPGEERYFTSVKQLTHGGSNAEAYFSWDGKRIIYQWTGPDHPCDLIYTMKPDGSDVQLRTPVKKRPSKRSSRLSSAR